MAQLLPLNNSFMTAFREILSGGMTFGPLLAGQSLSEGTIRVWMPSTEMEVQPEMIRSDIFWPKPFYFHKELHLFLDRYFMEKRDGILIADTPCLTSDENNLQFLGGLSWFSCDSPRKASIKQISVYLAAKDADDQHYQEVLGVSHPYPTTIVLTSLPDELAICSGEHYPIDSHVIQSLVARVEHILMGVFDEMSMMVWSRP